MTTAGQPARPRRRPSGGPGISWAGDGALARRVYPEAVARPSAASADALAGHAIGPAPLASFGRRAMGFAIDFTILTLVGQFMGMFVLSGGQSIDPFSIDEAFARLVLANSTVRLVYNWYFNARGWSPGKRAVGIRIVTAEGDAPGVRRGFTRAAVAVLSEAALWIGYVWAAWDARNQTWHDKFAGTYVVVAEPERREAGGSASRDG